MNIVPEDDVGFVADSGQSEPGLRHDLDEAISSEGAAGSDLHAGRLKSLRHLFMMDVQQPATRGRITPSPTDARQRSERALFIVVLAVRSTHRLIAAPVAESLWGARTGQEPLTSASTLATRALSPRLSAQGPVVRLAGAPHGRHLEGFWYCRTTSRSCAARSRPKPDWADRAGRTGQNRLAHRIGHAGRALRIGEPRL